MPFPKSSPPGETDLRQEPKVASAERLLKVWAGLVIVGLALGFLTVHLRKSAHQRALAHLAAQAAATPPAVEAITVERAPSAQALVLPGETAAWYASTIYARVDGYVARWRADIGDRVHKGQVLATIETPDLDARWVAAQAQLKSARALVVARQADADFARTTYARWRDSPQGVVSDQERAAKKADYDSAVARLDEARAQVRLDQAEADRYAVLTRFKRVTAPYDGTVTERRIDIGNLVTAGSTANTTPLYRMVQDDPIRVFSDVPQSAAADIRVGIPVQITTGNPVPRLFTGKVTRTAEAISPQTRTLRVEADLPNPGHGLVSGMYVNVRFQVPNAGWVRVPAAALLFRSHGPQVAVIDRDNRVAFRAVTIARDNGSTVDLAAGVSAGERVALNLSNQIAAGETVAVQDDTEASHGPAPHP